MSLRTIRLARLTAVILLGLSSHAFAAQQAPVQDTNAIQARVDALAHSLAKLVSPSADATFEFARRAFEKSFDDAQGQEARSLYPGLMKALWGALEPEFRAVAVQDQAGYEARLAELYARALTLAEIEAVLRFYQSPTGRKFIQAMHEESNFDGVMAEAVQEEVISEASMVAAKEKGKSKVLASLNGEDNAALTEFAKSVSPAKMNALGREVQKLTVDWINRLNPEFDARVGKIAEVFVSKYIEEHPPKE